MAGGVSDADEESMLGEAEKMQRVDRPWTVRRDMIYVNLIVPG